MRDTLYTREPMVAASFEFNQQVAEVFPDMIARSVPGYAATLRLIGSIADRYVKAGSRCYDLGCSRGAALLSVYRQIGDRAELVAVDQSASMMAALKQDLAANEISCVESREEDIRETLMENASLTILNFTLQFIPPVDRLSLLSKIAGGTRPGGVLVLSEKIQFADPEVEREWVALHEAFKRENGYSDLEISRKRTALEKVLIPETLEVHRERLREAGFSRSQVWLQCFNFASLLAFRD
ncbi:MAG: carboxy-S-adenosyl-L-methionine synthase CmoA [Kiritimatiellae bacterium]|jgi:tRNA (cmo5U34)-methyltransferase|nr:carboxy-S-adenosyl-L-methionine synthase CmoA [Kiritimatiellia bacterium]